MSPRRSRAAQDGQPIPLADLGQAGVVGQGLPEVVAGVPAQAEAVGHDPQKLPPRAEALEEHDHLQLDEDHGIDARPAPGGVAVPHEVAHQGASQLRLQLAVEVVGGHEVVERHGVERAFALLLGPQHGLPPHPSQWRGWRKESTRPGHPFSKGRIVIEARTSARMRVRMAQARHPDRARSRTTLPRHAATGGQ